MSAIPAILAADMQRHEDKAWLEANQNSPMETQRPLPRIRGTKLYGQGGLTSFRESDLGQIGRETFWI